jgi:tyrosyl-tRNA synthetase
MSQSIISNLVIQQVQLVWFCDCYILIEMKMTLSEELVWRGFVNQTTVKNISDLDKSKWTFYHGFDASAPSQTIGNLAAMMFDKVFMRHGHKAVILAGGATSQIGDPGGKDVERELQSEKVILQNVANATKQLKNVFSGHDFVLVNNLDWTKKMTVIEFLRDVGKHFSMTPLVQRDYIAKRIGQDGSGISYTEFSYTILQGMDYLHLFDELGVNLQLGGSDQWGNCLSGVDLIRRARGKEVHAITLPLIINKATGKKFGKSEAGAVWLDPKMTSPYKFYQFWLNVEDEAVEGYLKVFTELQKPEVDAVMGEFAANRKERSAQKRLAFEVTNLVHGAEVAEQQRRIADMVFGSRLSELSAKDFAILSEELPYAELAGGCSLHDAVLATGLVASKSDARRIASQGGLKVIAKVIEQPLEDKILTSDESTYGYFIVVKGGRHKALLKLIKR